MFLFMWACLSLPALADPFLYSSVTFLNDYFDLQNELAEKLFENYNYKQPMVFLADRYSKAKKVVWINVTMTYFRLLRIDEERQSAKISVDLYYQWTDPRLTWNVSDYCGMEEIAVTNKETVWLPDVQPIDLYSISDTLEPIHQTVNIAYDGRMGLYKTTIVDIICRMDIRDFPFDKQSCPLRMASANFHGQEMRIRASFPEQESKKYSSDGKFSLGKMEVKNIAFQYGGRMFANPEFWFYFERTTDYYLHVLIIPSFILTLLCNIGLFWKPIRANDYPKQILFGFVAILTMMANLQIGAVGMPKVNQTDKLSIYLLTNLCLIAFALSVILLVGKMTYYYWKYGDNESNLYKLLKFKIYKYLHLVFMGLFMLMAVANLVVLFTYKNPPAPKCPKG